MRRYYSGLLRYLPAAPSFALLAWQLAIPFTVPRFAAQRPQGATYLSARSPLLNLVTPAILNAAGAMFSASLAQPILASLAMLIGYLSIAYANRALAPYANPWNPMANFVLQTWFLWLGFYSFYLGMALAPFAIGYYARHAGCFTRRRTAVLTALLLLILLTNPIAASVALLAVLCMAGWSALIQRPHIPAKEIAWTAGFVLAACALAAGLAPRAEAAWRQFPMHVFVTAEGPDGSQQLLRRIVLAYIVAAALLLRKREWRSLRGGIFAAAVGAFLLYLFVPDAGFGAALVKIRYSWGVFLLGALGAFHTSRLRWAQAPLALCVAALLADNLMATQHALQQAAGAADDSQSIAQKRQKSILPRS